MKTETLHIVCLDAPSPPDYGGAIDMFYKIRALAASGKKIILHYFQYRDGRGVTGLENYCAEIHAYSRKSLWQSPPIRQPFITASRINTDLIKRLESDNYPILLEGIHCAGLISLLKDASRVVLRIHNDEARYYKQLHAAEHHPVKKLYFGMEARLLKSFQQQLDKKIKLALLSQTDMEIFQSGYGFEKTTFIPCFIPWHEVKSNEGKGWYCLYHGNLEVSENEGAAAWLIDHVFRDLSIPLVIAGRGISKRLQQRAAHLSHIRFVNNPPMDELGAIIRDAHLHVLPSLNATGVKLKLIHALFEGRHCLTNSAGVAGSGLEAAVHLADAAEDFKKLVLSLWEMPFEPADIQKRKALLQAYDINSNAVRLNALW